MTDSYEVWQQQTTEEVINQWLNKAIKHYKDKNYDLTLIACERAIKLDQKCARAHHGKGLALIGLKLYKEALDALEKALQINPNNAKIYTDLSQAYEQALHIDSDNAKILAHKSKAVWTLVRQGKELHCRECYIEAIAAFDQALQIDPSNATILYEKDQAFRSLVRAGKNLYDQERYAEAIAVYDQALQIDPSSEGVVSLKRWAVEALNRYKEKRVENRSWMCEEKFRYE